MELLHERCAALDIGKKDLKACVRTPNPTGKRSRRQEIRTYATTTNSLLELRDWLVAEQVTLVVLEATGNSMAVSRVLTPFVTRVIIANPLQVKAIAQAHVKTDKIDAGVLASLRAADFLPEIWLPGGTKTIGVRTEHLRVAESNGARLVGRVHRVEHLGDQNHVPHNPPVISKKITITVTP